MGKNRLHDDIFIDGFFKDDYWECVGEKYEAFLLSESLDDFNVSFDVIVRLFHSLFLNIF